MKFKTVILLSFLLTVLGCTKDNVKEELDVTEKSEMIMKSLAFDETGVKARSLNSHLQGMEVERNFKFNDIAGVMYYTSNPELCGLFPEFVIEGSGFASHMGTFTLRMSFCVDLEGNPLTTRSGIMWAANGDQIFTELTDEWMEDGVYYLYTEVTGGTGRFTEANGWLLWYGEIDFASLTWNMEGYGSINY